jgi:17 kDa common-antigen outer membrane protein
MTGTARRGAVAGAALVVLLSQAACQGLGLTLKGAATAEPAAARPAPRPSDPVLAFVAAASAGQSTSLDDPTRGRIEVRLEREYDSADGVLCRRFTLMRRQDIKTGVACRTPEGWQLDPVLGNETAH